MLKREPLKDAIYCNDLLGPTIFSNMLVPLVKIMQEIVWTWKRNSSGQNHLNLSLQLTASLLNQIKHENIEDTFQVHS